MNEAAAAAGLDARSTSGASAVQESDDLKIHTSDFPGMVLVSTPLVRNNYLLWSRSIKVALTAKMKMSFIDGTYLKPAGNSEECKQWIRTDSMVFSWIMNSISKDIAKAFSYAKSARSLWLQLEARFGQANGPMIYNLQREIASISQGNMDIVSYFTKIAMLWDELECVDPTPECSCSSQRTMADKVASTQLMQFLMGLNDSFDAIRSQILVMDPLPSVDKAYSLVLRVESQRQSSINIQDVNNNAAMTVRGTDFKRETGGKAFQQKKQYTDKKNLYCTHCTRSGHSKESCFKLHGYPEWFKDLSDKRKRYGSDARALNAFISDSAVVPQQEETTQTLSVMMSELLQMMKGKTQSDQAQVNYAKMGEFAGTYFNYTTEFLGPNSWIIDSGATAHMCANLKLMNRLKPYIAESSVALPDGTRNMSHTRKMPTFSSEPWDIASQDMCLLSTTEWSSGEKTQTPTASGTGLNVSGMSSFTILDRSILTATYIINRLPTSVLRWKTPYEVLYNRSVDYSMVRTFGCLAFATNVLPQKSKFTKRAYRCIFVGYAFGQKGYKLFDLDDKVLFVSRDVVFHEGIFPYKNTPDSRNEFPFPVAVRDEDSTSNQTTSAPIHDSAPINSVDSPHHSSLHNFNPLPEDNSLCTCIKKIL
ncbi:UNVERIFIED_CONTAM: hypothetical protein Sradi_6828100 [Sesamum radiatum]|uniref:Retrotransposon Copia-like N-terminal domain-containing protein n=1 Tax=Sesamum radiatum TaxID=300843 RepID=A0AAW2JVN7_SESRA